MKYYKLLDNENFNTVVRACGENQEEYIHGEGWVQSGILMEYFCDESPLYGLYEEISKDEAEKLIADN